MNRDTFKGQCQQWGKVTDDDIAQIQGNAEQLIGKIQEHYGRSREEAEREIDRWLADRDHKA